MSNIANSFFLWTYFKIDKADNKQQILKAIYERAYLDATVEGAFNTLLTTDAMKKAAVISKENALKTLDEYISDFTSKSVNYDEWHNKLCLEIKSCYSKEINDGLLDRFTYGNAQKLVNMTMKYLYLLSETEIEFDDEEIRTLLNKVNAFSSSLHIPVDSYIIDAIWRNTDIKLPLRENATAKRQNKNYKCPSDYVAGWSTWDEDTYKTVKNELFKYLKHNKINKPIEWESVMWIEEAKNRKA